MTPSIVAEPGGPVTYTVVVTNPSVEKLTLTSLTDDKFDSLAGKGSCSVPQDIAPKGNYTCTFSAEVKGDPKTPHINTVTGKAKETRTTR